MRSVVDPLPTTPANPPPFVTVAVSVLAIGVLPATAQWVILRRSTQTWGSYVIRFAFGLAVGGLAGWLTGTASGLTFPSGPAWVVVGTAMGAAIGLTTARPVTRSIAASAAHSLSAAT